METKILCYRERTVYHATGAQYLFKLELPYFARMEVCILHFLHSRWIHRSVIVTIYFSTLCPGAFSGKE